MSGCRRERLAKGDQHCSERRDMEDAAGPLANQDWEATRDRPVRRAATDGGASGREAG
jgi:hypothetical protein